MVGLGYFFCIIAQVVGTGDDDNVTGALSGFVEVCGRPRW